MTSYIDFTKCANCGHPKENHRIGLDGVDSCSGDNDECLCQEYKQMIIEEKDDKERRV